MIDENRTMSWQVLVVVLLGVSSCTKTNPAVCCTSTSDCAAVGLSTVKPCADGLLCRGNQCIAETCMSSADCDASAPFCDTATCMPTCSDDTQCPGFGENPGDLYCVSGECVSCRANMNDCSAAAPVCDMGACRGCATDGECASNVCDVHTGACVSEPSIRYADPNGSDANDCSLTKPCTLTKALSIVDTQHPWLRVLPGIYTTGQIMISNVVVHIVGTGATIIPMNGIATGALFVSSNANVSIRGLTLDATSNGDQGLECQPASGTASLLLEDVTAKVNSAAIAYALYIQQQCQVQIHASNFIGLIGFGANSASVVDSTRFNGNWSVYNNSSTAGIQLEVTNSVIVDPLLAPSLTNNPTPGAIRVYFAYNTLYSSNGFVASCTSTSVPSTALTFIDNIFYAPTAVNAFAVSSGCTGDTNVAYPRAATSNPGANAITLDPKLVDAANGDFHLQPTSPAIDMAKPTANDPSGDIDGTTRPQGAAYDIGAYEYKP